MTGPVYTTRHAIQRYQERIDDCSHAEAKDRLLHAYEIALPASARQRRWFLTRQGAYRDTSYTGSLMYYCPVESLLLACRRAEQGGILVLTVIRYPM